VNGTQCSSTSAGICARTGHHPQFVLIVPRERGRTDAAVDGVDGYSAWFWTCMIGEFGDPAAITIRVESPGSLADHENRESCGTAFSSSSRYTSVHSGYPP
jgi:hypothetical protein